ncbi:hypothetical protein L0337_06320 [candidate division KSB1 bacterium]|nr:hypothetical protein [candidate division KSB1 bacterium]
MKNPELLCVAAVIGITTAGIWMIILVKGMTDAYPRMFQGWRDVLSAWRETHTLFEHILVFGLAIGQTMRMGKTPLILRLASKEK